MMKFVIYGAGCRGKNALEYLGSDNVIAFIDSDEEKLKKPFCKKKVITLKEYIGNYYHYGILISAYSTLEIEAILKENNIFQYSTARSLPSEFCGHGDLTFEECYGGLKEKINHKCAIYGVNIFALMLYEYLNPEIDVCIIPQKEDERKVGWLKEQYPDILLGVPDKISTDTCILVTIDGLSETDKAIIKDHILINMLDYSSNAPDYRNKEIGKFKNMFQKQKRCFVIATGPSLRISDLEVLKRNDEFCIGMNKIYLLQEDWVADAYVCVDSKLLDTAQEDIDAYPCKHKFIADGSKKFWSKKHLNTYKIHSVADQYTDKSKFSEDICQKVYQGFTVTYVCLQIAVYLGFTEIYLLGVDCDYVRGGTKNYFFLTDEKDMFDHHTAGMLSNYQTAKKYSEEHGIKIYNATRGGKLEIFERVEFDRLFDQG